MNLKKFILVFAVAIFFVSIGFSSNSGESGNICNEGCALDSACTGSMPYLCKKGWALDTCVAKGYDGGYCGGKTDQGGYCFECSGGCIAQSELGGEKCGLFTTCGPAEYCCKRAEWYKSNECKPKHADMGCCGGPPAGGDRTTYLKATIANNKPDACTDKVKWNVQAKDTSEFVDHSTDCVEGNPDVKIESGKSMAITCTSEKLPSSMTGPHTAKISWCGGETGFSYVSFFAQVPMPTPMSCTDTDGGYNIYQTGTCISNGTMHADYCIDKDFVQDYLCSSLGACTPTPKTYCGYGCSNGACNTAFPTQTPARPPTPTPVPTPCGPGYSYDAYGNCKSNDCVTVLDNGNPADKLDIVFVECDYRAGETSKFEADVNAHMKELLSTEPFSSNKNKINIHRVNRLGTLSCRVLGDRCLIGNFDLTRKVASLCPNDEIIVLGNDRYWAGCASDIAHSSSKYPWITVHEFGHTFGDLMDEYVYAGPPASPDTHPRGPNCDETASCPKWAGTPEDEGCYLGCSASNWYRPSEHSLMRDYGPFNKVSIKALNEKLSVYS